MSTVFFVLFVICLVLVVVSLFAGVIVMGRPGEEHRRCSNNLMRIRIASQAGVILFLILFLVSR